MKELNNLSNQTYQEAKRILWEADNIYLVGNAYHRENMEYIDMNSNNLVGKLIVGSSYNIIDKDRDKIRRTYTRITVPSENLRVLDFIKTHVDLD